MSWEESDKFYKGDNPHQLFPLAPWEPATIGAHLYRLYTIN